MKSGELKEFKEKCPALTAQSLVPALQLLQTENVRSKNCAVSQFYKTITSLLQPAAGSSGVIVLWNTERMMSFCKTGKIFQILNMHPWYKGSDTPVTNIVCNGQGNTTSNILLQKYKVCPDLEVSPICDWRLWGPVTTGAGHRDHYPCHTGHLWPLLMVMSYGHLGPPLTATYGHLLRSVFVLRHFPGKKRSHGSVIW